VPQRPADLLYGDTVADECRLADRESGAQPGTAAALLERIAGPVDAAAHPSDLSEGQRLALALAVVLSSAPPLLLLDEPTRGLDYAAKARLAAALGELARGGTGLVLATHDVELAAEISDRTVVLAEGEIVADGPSREVVTSSPVFAPQVAKVLAPLPYLTVSDVARTLAGAAASR
jgi:energy-coupling factor transport system ATP-binding protein